MTQFSDDILKQLDTISLDVTDARKCILIPPGMVDPPKDENDVPSHLLILSQHSKQARAYTNKIATEAFEKMKTAGLSASMEADDESVEAVERLLSVLVGWHLVDAAGKKIDIPFTLEHARMVLSHPERGWMLRRGLLFYTADSNFMKASPRR